MGSTGRRLLPCPIPMRCTAAVLPNAVAYSTKSHRPTATAQCSAAALLAACLQVLLRPLRSVRQARCHDGLQPLQPGLHSHCGHGRALAVARPRPPNVRDLPAAGRRGEGKG